jgi:hypothetical protein
MGFHFSIDLGSLVRHAIEAACMNSIHVMARSAHTFPGEWRAPGNRYKLGFWIDRYVRVLATC